VRGHREPLLDVAALGWATRACGHLLGARAVLGLVKDRDGGLEGRVNSPF
jgi:hypothetical protein